MKRISVIFLINLLVFGGRLVLLGSAILAGSLQSGAMAEQRVRLALTGAGTAASLLVDPDFVRTLTPNGVDTAPYKKTEASLEKLVATFGLSDLYVLRLKPGATDAWQFLFDTLDGPFLKDKGKEGGFTPYESPPEEVGEAWKGSAPVVTAQPYTDEFGTFRSAFLTLSDASGQPVVVVGSDFNMAQLGAAQQAVVFFGVGLGLGGLMLLMLLAWILGLIVHQPLQKISRRFAALASGTADLTEVVVIKGRDELADLAAGFNGFVEKLRILVSDLQSGVHETSGIQGRLQRDSEETTQTVAQTKEGLEALNRLGIRLETAVLEVLRNLEAITANEATLDTLARTQEQTTVRAALDHGVLDQAAADLRREAEEVGQALAAVDRQSVENGRRMDAGLAVLRTLQNEVQAVTGIVATILNTAEATALLAMNASIEAAHAGVQGRGFTVIAQRMRLQAETSRADADRIGETLEGMVTLIGQAALNIEETAAGAKTTRDRLGQTSQLVGKLTQSGENLESYTRRSRTLLEELRGASREVALATGAMTSETLTISSAMRSLQDVSQTMLKETGDILQGTQSVAAVVDNIQAAANKLSTVSGSLEENLRRFKTV